MRKWLAFALAWVLILGGAFLAHSIQTMGGTTVTEVRIPAEEGVTVSAGYRGLFSERLEDNQVGIKLNVSW